VPIISQLNVQGLYGTDLIESSLSGMSTLVLQRSHAIAHSVLLGFGWESLPGAKKKSPYPLSHLAWPERRLHPGGRFGTHAKFDPCVEAVVEHFLLGQVPYKHKSAVLKELSKRSHDPKVWTSERLSYWIKKGHVALSAPPSSKRAAETSPSGSNITEGFAVSTDDSVPLDMTIFDDEPNPLGGHPEGTDSASRDAKKSASKALLDSASKERYTKGFVFD